MSDRRRAPHHQVQYHQMQADRNVLVSTFHSGSDAPCHTAVSSKTFMWKTKHSHQFRRTRSRAGRCQRAVTTCFLQSRTRRCTDHCFMFTPQTPNFLCAWQTHVQVMFGDRAVDAEELKEMEHDKEKGRRQNSTSRTRRWTSSKTKCLSI